MKRFKKISWFILGFSTLLGLSSSFALSCDDENNSPTQVVVKTEPYEEETPETTTTISDMAVELHPGEIDKLCPFDGTKFKEFYYDGEKLDLKVNINSPADEKQITFIWSIKLLDGEIITIDNKTNHLKDFEMLKKYDGGKFIITALFENTSTLTFPIKIIDSAVVKPGKNAPNLDEENKQYNKIFEDLTDNTIKRLTTSSDIIDSDEPQFNTKNTIHPRHINGAFSD